MSNIRVLISEEEVDKKIREMAAEISKKWRIVILKRPAMKSARNMKAKNCIWFAYCAEVCSLCANWQSALPYP